MKRIVLLLIICCGCLLISGCGNQKIEDRLFILTTNDFHGALTETNNNYGIARTASYIDTIREKHSQGTVVLSAGDSFQGSALSNITFGRTVLDVMNLMDFDAMTIGNHEFDWEIETILKYRDGNLNNGEAEFPFVTSNIYNKTTNLPLDNTDEYTIIERLGIKIGIVGYIGLGLESSIAVPMVKEYEFRNPVETVATVAEKLRTENDVDFIIALGHDGNDTTNQSLANLSGDRQVDVIINGHEHINVSKTIRAADDRLIPVVQAGSVGEYVGEIEFQIDHEKDEINFIGVKNIKMDHSISKDETINNYVNQISSQYAGLLERVIGVAGRRIVKQDIENWSADVMMNTFDVDFGVINRGGIRSEAFPISVNENITISKMYQIMPFDNTVKICELTGAQIMILANMNGLAFSNNFIKNGSTIRINDETLIYNKTYKVAAVDYIFDDPSYPFLNGVNQEATFKLLRDVMIETIEKLTNDDKRWLE